ncbi:hypothetical protein E1B28_003049 [Marasmius oreades]|uniref:Uncharacterized protein n=1 Tax=Marasmius oreades TaxID=181124 RepID=A0A9P7ULT6_9AGAR|nr:uncharacterized protein E1B28_003049 [Marasmius oreades]KAG7085486.1 hypothetical protein E1B28_003049 [Marasmius oreades]
MLFGILVSLCLSLEATALPSYGIASLPTRITLDRPLTLTWFRDSGDQITTLEIIPVVEGGKPVTSFRDNRILVPVGTETQGDITITPTVTGLYGFNLQADPTTPPTVETSVALPVMTLLFVSSAASSSHPHTTGTHTTPPPTTSTTASPSVPTTTSSPTKKQNSVLIVALIVGLVAGVILLLLVAYFIWRRKQSKTTRVVEYGPLAITPFQEAITTGYPSSAKILTECKGPGPSGPASATTMSTTSYTYNGTTSPSRTETPQDLYQGTSDSIPWVRREQDGGRVPVEEAVTVLPPQYDIRWCNNS